MLINIWPGYWEDKSEKINMRVYEVNEKSVGMVKGGLVKFGGFQVMNFGITLVVSFWIIPLVLGG